MGNCRRDQEDSNDESGDASLDTVVGIETSARGSLGEAVLTGVPAPSRVFLPKRRYGVAGFGTSSASSSATGSS
jgi:hypothetical protein